eukprot:3408690-Prymnesium_polylepis.1
MFGNRRRRRRRGVPRAGAWATSRRSGGAESHGVRSMEDRVQGPALSAAQAENVLEAIRSAAEVNSGLDAHAWTNAEMIRVREVFASAA